MSTETSAGLHAMTVNEDAPIRSNACRQALGEQVSMDTLFRALTVTPLGQPETELVLNVADEVPVRLTFNGIFPHGVMMMTPDDLEDFAYGYCLTEEIIHCAANVRAVAITQDDDGLTMDITLAGECLSALLKRRPRVQTGHTSCGICGTDEVPGIERSAAPLLPLTHTIAVDAVRKALNDLDTWQRLNAATRMVHAAAWSNADGCIQIIREDVGRHNALDKLIGARMRNEIATGNGFCLLTSRYSFEMALKTVRAGIAVVVAVSAPTYRAFCLAEKAHQTLVAVARRDRQIVFCGGERVTK